MLTSHSPLCSSTIGQSGPEQGVQTIVCPALCGPGLDFVLKFFPLCGDLGICFCSNLWSVGQQCSGTITVADDDALSNICTSCGGTIDDAFDAFNVDVNSDGGPTSNACRARLFGSC